MKRDQKLSLMNSLSRKKAGYKNLGCSPVISRSTVPIAIWYSAAPLDLSKFSYILIKISKKISFMAKNSSSITALPPATQAKLEELGRRIKLARKRRGLTLHEMAKLMLVSVGSLQRLEAGTPGTSLGTLATALLTLGLENDMDSVAAMETDMIGLAHERRRLEGKPGSKDKISYDF